MITGKKQLWSVTILGKTLRSARITFVFQQSQVYGNFHLAYFKIGYFDFKIKRPSRAKVYAIIYLFQSKSSKKYYPMWTIFLFLFSSY